MTRRFDSPASLAVLAVALAGACAATTARAAPDLDGCSGFIDTVPAIVAKPGIWCLRSHLGYAGSSGAAITVTAGNATIACNGFRLRGQAAPVSTTATGILASNRQNVRVDGCRIAGFATGISLVGAGHEVTGNHVEAIGTVGIHVQATPGLVRGNRVNDVGWWGERSGARGIFVIGDVDVIDNGVDRVRGANATGRVPGIHAQGGQSNVIADNRVMDVTNTLAGGTSGVQAGAGNAGSRTIVQRNTLMASASGSAGIGLVCGGATVLTVDNLVTGWTKALSPACASHGDTVSP